MTSKLYSFTIEGSAVAIGCTYALHKFGGGFCMNDFTFWNPVKIHFGKDSMQQLAKEVAPYNTVLVVYGGGSIKTNGVYEQVMQALEGKKVFELSGVEPNPRVSTARKGAEICKAENVDLVLAVGGGSVIDCSKLIVAAAKTDADAWDIVLKKVLPTEAVALGTYCLCR